ncbi:ExeA family protein [Propionivibrio dicarboxylicus]|uniref:MSHA biogenesis protein MshM n=1 Tax=Propionivibrio dicarboxylicus TaxID=83767 RepID=A0A1G8IKA0_9RHOO|nr:AAA family ATPase [Propionivibrio dicarboxylicus]SDI19376.1 MSHA biogenesis protein MshM [Propionivibrio dicarboxylicus]
MYLKHFGLSELPFRITPDTSFVFANRQHQEALNTLLMALQEGEGFIKITGEVGSGKTLLCRRLLQSLGNEWSTAYLPNPSLDPDTLFLAIAEELGVKDAVGLDHFHLVRRINRALLDVARAKKRVVVCIDEVQAMPLPTLEALRLLSNLETEKRKLVQIVLFGQPELDERLRRPEIRQLLQRITFHCRLQGVEKLEIGNYVEHRLRVGGYRGDALFTPGALRALFRASSGMPRLINILAHKAMLSAFGEGVGRIDVKHIRLASKDTEGAKSLRWFWF